MGKDDLQGLLRQWELRILKNITHHVSVTRQAPTAEAVLSAVAGEGAAGITEAVGTGQGLLPGGVTPCVAQGGCREAVAPRGTPGRSRPLLGSTSYFVNLLSQGCQLPGGRIACEMTQSAPVTALLYPLVRTRGLWLGLGWV